MLERDGELRLLEAAASRLHASQGGTVIISGEAGIGKSSLIEAFLAGVGGGVRVLRGWCDDLITANPLGPIREAVHGSPDIVAAVPALDRALSEGDVASALVGLHEAFSQPPPYLLVIEDLHWADDATLDALAYLTRRLEHLRLLLVCSLRPEESATPELRRLLGGLSPRGTERIELRPLSRAAVAELNGAAAWDTDELLHVTGGNPFYLTEALAGSPGEAVPPTVSDAVLARLHRVSPSCLRALEKLSVWSGELPYDLLEAVLGDDADGVVEAEAKGLLTGDDVGVRFRHELARRATEQTLPTVRRRAIDRHLVDALAVAADDLPRLLHHATRCGAGEVIARYAPEAGDYSARVGANRQAIEYFEAALAHEPLLGTGRLAQVCDSHAWALHIAHRFDEAVAQGRRAVRLWAECGDARAQAAALRRLARELVLAAQPDEAIACAERARDLSEGFDTGARAEALGALGSHYALAGDPRAVPLLEQARALVGSGALPGTASLSLNYLAFALTDKTPDERVEMLRESLAAGQRELAHEAVARAWTNLVEMLYRTGRMNDAWDALAEGLAFVRQHGYWSHAFNLDVHHALVLLRRGCWAEAEGEFEEVVARYDDPGMLLTYSLGPYARLLARRGDPRAEAMLRRCWTLALRIRLLTGLAFAGAGLAEWAWLAGRPDVARDVLDAWRPHARRPTADIVDAEIRRYAARVGVTEDRPVVGRDPWSTGLRGDWQGAAAAWADIGDPYERALELCDSGEPEQALDGLRTLDLLEATAVATVVRGRLVELGIRVVPRGPSPRTRLNPVGLTDRQFEVVQLVAAGMTNAEIAAQLFVSVRTVDHHISAALARLGITSRREVAATLDALGV